MPWLFPLFAFLIGSIPFGLLIARSKGVDIRKHGSGNIGATNVMRIIGKKAGLSCLLLDFFKGFLPVLLAINLCRLEEANPLLAIEFLKNLSNPFPRSEQLFVQTIQVLTGLAAILGHNYSPWVRFKGGKGIATTAGVLAGLMPAAVVLLILIFIIVTFTTKYVSLGSVAAAISLPILTHLGSRFHRLDDSDPTSPTLWEAGTWNKPLFFFALFAGIMAVIRHRGNLQRIRKGTEDKIGSKDPDSIA